MEYQERVVSAVRDRFPDAYQGTGSSAGQSWAVVGRAFVVPVLRMIRDDLGANVLMDLTCVDWLNAGQPERFCVVYQLLSTHHNGTARIKAWVPEGDPEIDTVTGLWKAAGWAEREVWDMFGVRFNGHPDLRRILLPFDYEGHPLRKDYPLVGNGERQNFPRYVK